MRLAQISLVAIMLLRGAPAMALEDSSYDVPAQAMQTTMRTQGFVHRVRDRLVLVAVPVDATTEVNLSSIGFRKCTRIEAVESRTLFNAHAYFEYEIDEKPLLAALIEAKIGHRVTLELRRDASGRAVVTDVR
jgi:hypothetical protein